MTVVRTSCPILQNRTPTRQQSGGFTHDVEASPMEEERIAQVSSPEARPFSTSDPKIEASGGGRDLLKAHGSRREEPPRSTRVKGASRPREPRRNSVRIDRAFTMKDGRVILRALSERVGL
jgi:hypothetical protein